MAELFDYLDWRGDVPFSVDPFNEVDSAVLSELAYVDFGGIVPEPEEGVGIIESSSIAFEEAVRRFWELHTEEEVRSSGTLFKMAPFILEKMCSGGRFGGMRLAGYVNKISNKSSEQMSAVTCFLEDGTAFVSFRGTDDTLIGWKEDCTFMFMKETAGQRSAADYLSDNFRDSKNPLRVGGHSKGGNFAVYAAAFCAEEVRKKILDVYSNDGPGFLKEVTAAQAYRDILPLVHSVVPEETIVGILLDNLMPDKVVKSSQKGLYQHDMLSWKVRRNRFEEAKGLSVNSILAERALESWANEMTEEERKETVDLMFSLLTESGFENLSEITMDRLRVIPGLVRSYWELKEKDRRLLSASFRKLLLSGAASLKEDIQGKLGTAILPDGPDRR